jgi:hypothetical protein
MVSPVKSRPNHYDMLGLAPEASADEIARAFAREMGIAGAQPIGAAARICAAYETLRDPVRRRDYDRSIGIVPKPRPQVRQWAFPAPQPHWSPLVASVGPQVAAPPERRPEPMAEPDTIAERASRIADTLRELARPIERAPAAKPEPAPPPQKSAYVIEPDIRELLTARSDEPQLIEERAFDWRRPVLAVGGLVVGAGLIGALAGLWVKGDVDPAQDEPALTVGIPAARAHAVAAAPEPAVEAAAPRGHARAAVPTVRTKRAAPPLQLAQRPSVESEPVDNQFVDSATEQAAAQDPLAPAPPAAVAADLPLPEKVIARTIERIGYSCGSVTSSAAVDGASGVFKVTCSSGQTYRAAPVHGRYRFKRWSGG